MEQFLLLEIGNRGNNLYNYIKLFVLVIYILKENNILRDIVVILHRAPSIYLTRFGLVVSGCAISC